jgi:hypothetical protein
MNIVTKKITPTNASKVYKYLNFNEVTDAQLQAMVK